MKWRNGQQVHAAAIVYSHQHRKQQRKAGVEKKQQRDTECRTDLLLVVAPPCKHAPISAQRLKRTRARRGGVNACAFVCVCAHVCACVYAFSVSLSLSLSLELTQIHRAVHMHTDNAKVGSTSDVHDPHALQSGYGACMQDCSCLLNAKLPRGVGACDQAATGTGGGVRVRRALLASACRSSGRRWETTRHSTEQRACTDKGTQPQPQRNARAAEPDPVQEAARRL